MRSDLRLYQLLWQELVMRYYILQQKCQLDVASNANLPVG